MVVDIRAAMEILNSVWTVGVIAVVIILVIYARWHFRRVGWAPHVRLAVAVSVLLMGDVVQRSTIFWWHHEFNRGIRLPLDIYYPQLALGCTFAIAGIFISIRVLSEAYWGWPSCLRVSIAVLAIATLLVFI